MRLDVAVHDALIVSVLKGFTDLGHDLKRLFRRQSARPFALSQVLPVDILHDEVVEVARDSEVMHADDWMVQARK